MSIVPPIQDFEIFEAETVKMLQPPFRSKFGALRWEDQDKASEKPYEFQVAGILPRGQTILWFGESQSGKSFSAFDAGVHVAAGMEYQGRRTKKGGVIYCCVEKGSGARNRMRAFKQHYDLPKDLPFATLRNRFDIFTEEKTVDDLAEECRHLAEPWDVPLDVIVVDTHDKATPGASEIDKKDISTVMARYEKLRDLTGAAIWIIGHSNAFGSARGSLVLYNAIETVIRISVCGDNRTGDYRDTNGRLIREARVAKQSEGEAGTTWKFVLPAVEVDRNEYDEPITSCVVEEPAGEGDEKKPAFKPTANDSIFLKALIAALVDHGVDPPSGLGLPPSIRKVVHYDHVKAAYRDLNPDDGDDTDKHRETLKKALQRSRTRLMDHRIISAGSPYVWPTGKPVKGFGNLSDNYREQAAQAPESPGMAEVEKEGIQL